MKSFTLKHYAALLAVGIFAFTACVTISSIIQPEKAAPNSSFDVQVTLGADVDPATDYTLGGQIDAGYIGILLPSGWTIDQDEFEFVKTASDPSFNYTGYVYEDTEHAAALEAKEPAPRGYKWWGGVSDVFDMHLFVDINFTIKILTDDQEGVFNLKYVIGDKNDTQNMGRYPWYREAVSDLIPITIEAGTGIGNAKVQDQIKVYPQITHDAIVVETPADQNCTIKILDIAGKLISKKNASGTLNTIHLSGHPQGVYIVSVTGDSYSKTAKVILQ